MNKRVLFLCGTNSCRSQMAEGLLRTLGKGEYDAYSAGAEATSVHPLAVQVMAEMGIDISHQKSKSVAKFTGQEFDFTITLCGSTSKTVCPVFLGKVGKRLQWDIADPAEAEGSEEEKLEVFRQVRDQLKTEIERFIQNQGSSQWVSVRQKA
jgi:arsenate reductase